ncbi:MAG: type II toxin-antitoxin system prevent-host-death family antitoxin [Pseudomonadota bacterium]
MKAHDGITTVTATMFKAKCLRLIDEMNRTGVPITVTKHGKAIATLSPMQPGTDDKDLFGSMPDSVLGFDDPTAPVLDPEDWEALR